MADVKHWIVSEPYLDLDCALGEAPFYEKTSHSLRFVDIAKQQLHVIDLDEGPSSLKTFDLDAAVSVTADIENIDEEIVVGAKCGYAVLHRKTGRLEYIKKIWDERDGLGKEERMRLNDGAVDSQGRFWAGAMNDPKVKAPSDEGVLFRLDPDMKLHRVIDKVTIPNGIGWSADDKFMFFTDSATKSIFKFDYDALSGDISNQRTFFHVEQEEEAPDGFAIDSDGCLWTAVFGGGRVLRISPQGEIVGEISLPTRCITCPAFVGEDLFITSASEENPKEYQSTKYAGNLFKVNVGIIGLSVNKFKRW